MHVVLQLMYTMLYVAAIYDSDLKPSIKLHVENLSGWNELDNLLEIVSGM